MIDHEYFMGEAIKEAKKALALQEVPMGAVIVKDNVIIGRGYNKKESTNNPTSHAEIEAIIDACKHNNDWRLNGAIMYVTAEPCIMCAGAIIHARIDKVYFGVKESKFGGVCSKISLFDDIKINHRVEWESGILSSEIEPLLKDFFQILRK